MSSKVTLWRRFIWHGTNIQYHHQAGIFIPYAQPPENGMMLPVMKSLRSEQ